MKLKLEPEKFKRIALRNAFLPLMLAVIMSAIFVGLIFQLVAVNRKLNLSDQIIGDAYQVLQLIVDAETGLRGFIITDNESFLEPYNESNQTLGQKLAELKSQVQDQPAQLEILKSVDGLKTDWSSYAEELIASNKNKVSVQNIVTSGQGKKITDAIRSRMDQFIDAETALRRQRNSSSQNYVRTALMVILSVSGVFGLFLAIFSRRQLDLVSSVYGDALNKQEAQAELLAKQAWLSEGQGKMAENLRGDHNLSDVCSRALQFLCNYTGAKVGSLYVLSGQELSLGASYAMDSDHLSKRLSAGESLLGQAVLEKKLVTLDPAPNGYLRVGSTLGATNASSVLIAPLWVNEQIKGVVELGFLRSLKPEDSDLLQRVSEGVGVAISSAQYRIRLHELLEESQRQAEELQAQQEELKVNNEELEEQSHALKDSQARLETQQSELEQTNSQLSQLAESLERQNDSLNESRAALLIKSQELQKANEYKSQFLANMSHELRTPLNSTLILSQLLIDNKSGRLSSEEVEYASTILSSSNDLLTLINDILDLSKVEAGKVELLPESVHIKDTLSGLERVMAPIAQQKKIALSLEIKSGTPEVFETDKIRLEQVLKNLLSNAVKFTKAGEVKLVVSPQAGGRLRFAVSDTGVGISEEKQRLIFEAFQQADGTTSRQFGGTGLGLTISQNLAKLLGGEISVQSETGKGSVFTFEIAPLSSTAQTARAMSEVGSLPLEIPKPKTSSRSAPQATKSARTFADDRGQIDPSARLLMVVEDDKAFARAILDISHDLNFQCIVAESAEEAVSLAVEYLPHAIILDMQLPDHTGLFVLDSLKENSATRHIPVHVISSQDFSKTALQMGAIGYLVKPASKENVIEVIQKLEEKLTKDIKKVLIIEDNNVQRESMKKLISDDSVNVVAVSTGTEAIDLLQSDTFDCLILDISLPDMTGYEILERMSQSQSLSHPPVIVYTGRDLSRDEELKLQKYSRSIILKGAKSPERLVSEVGLFLHQVESEMPVDRQKVLQELRNRERDLEGRHILLVDDDIRNIFALKNALEQRGSYVEVARNGLEAVSKVQTIPEIELVLMDIMMPEMDGFEAMREIRKDPKFKSLPIIAVTAKAMSDDKEKCLAEGANDYLSKPIDLQKLLSLIRVWLHPSRGR